MLSSSSAPFVIALLVSALGWQISQISEDIRQTRAISYAISVDETKETALLTISNVSREKAVKELTFSLVCEDQGDCFNKQHPDAPNAFAQIKAVRPFAPSVRFSHPAADKIDIVATIPAGSAISLLAYLVDGSKRPVMFYVPDADDPEDLFILRGDEAFGFAIVHYNDIMIWSFAIMLGVLVLWVLVAAGNGVLNLVRAKEGTDAPQRHHVSIVHSLALDAGPGPGSGPGAGRQDGLER